MAASDKRQRIFRASVFAALFFLFLAAEKDSFNDVRKPRTYQDTNSFMRSSEPPLLSKAFLSGRAIATPMLYKLTNRDALTIARTQSFLSVVCWFCLAVAVARELERFGAQLIAAALICLFSLSLPVNQWDYMLLSESLSFSLLALTLALTVALCRSLADGGKYRLPLTLLWAGSCLLLAVARDSNIYLLATLWGAGAIWITVDSVRRRAQGISPRYHRGLLLALLLLPPILTASYLALRYSLRWQDPLTNVLLRRVLPRAEVYDQWITDYGLPRNATFEKYAGQLAWKRSAVGPPIRKRFWSRDPEVENVRIWLTEHGLSSYVRYLVWDNLGESLDASFRAFSRNLSSRYVERNYSYGKGVGKTPWTTELTDWTYKKIRHPGTMLTILLASGFVFAILFPPARLLGIMSVFLAFSSWSQAFVTFHADTSNVNRHMLICGVLLRLGVLFVAAVGVDQILGALRREPASSTGAAASLPDYSR